VSRRRDAEEGWAQAQKMEALGQLTGGISHDFNNLLQVISGQLELLTYKLKAADIDRDKCLRNVEGAKQSVARAATLTQQLLAFSRKQRLEGRSISLNAIAKSVAELVQQSFGNRATGAIEVELLLDEALRNCQVDPSQLEVALLNVLLNARDAMQDGGTVRIRTDNFHIGPADSRYFSGLVPGDYVGIAISDSGSGIPKELIQRVIEPFFTTKDEGKGTGLGLSMVYGFTKQSGGTTQISSEPGQGTTVRLFFPAGSDSSRDARDMAVRASVRGGAERILVVDDRPEVAQIATRLLEALGYAVQTVHSASEALTLAQTLPPDKLPQLLFTDVIMPGGMNGIVLARKMRDKVPGLQVLLTTGYAGDVAAPNADLGSEFDLIYKPYQQEDLARKVRLVLDGATGSKP
jgi:nitrogen-specific signal transduction histidine kinase/ActR/RegA family two-component response regulator